MALGGKSPLQTWDDPKKPLGKNYRIPCSWQMYGVMDVRAESLEEAVKKASPAATKAVVKKPSAGSGTFSLFGGGSPKKPSPTPAATKAVSASSVNKSAIAAENKRKAAQAALERKQKAEEAKHGKNFD